MLTVLVRCSIRRCRAHGVGAVLVLQLDRSDQRADGYDQFLERAAWFYEAVSLSAAMKSQMPGAGQAYLGSYTDADGRWLDGGDDDVLHVPARTARETVLVGDGVRHRSRCLIDNPQQRGDRGSRDADLQDNPDGSVDVFFGPAEPAAGQSNWVQTLPDRHWFSYLRVLRAARAVLRPDVETRRCHTGSVVGGGRVAPSPSQSRSQSRQRVIDQSPSSRE